METVVELLRAGKKAEIWRRYCGFLDLGVDEYVDIQEKLLQEQLVRLNACELGRRIMGGASPRNLKEFRETVPITTYKNYAPFLVPKNEDMLPEKPHVWLRTSGTSGEYDQKLIPYTRTMYDQLGEMGFSAIILSSAKRRGEFALREGMTFPYTIAPPPYLSGFTLERLLKEFPFVTFPPMDKAVGMGFQERIKEAFGSALSEGLDFFFGVTSILLKISDSFSHMGGSGNLLASLLLKPRALLRILRALVKSTLKGRPLLPKDIWNVKGLLCGGMDTSVFRQRVVEVWGAIPEEVYAATEFGLFAIQTWSHEGFTFSPHLDFLEFILEKDYRSFIRDPSFIPKSFLMNEVQAGTEYVLVGTNFHGGALIRYVLGDLVKVTALEDRKAGVGLPQFTFISRIDDVIDIGGFTRLTEKTIWQAIENCGIPYEDWIVRKEFLGGKPGLHLYIEGREGALSAEAVTGRIHESLKRLDKPYNELEEITGLKPLSVSLLSKGTFHRYYEERQAAGAELAQLKPPHINASDKVLEHLLRMSSWKI